MQSKRSLQKLFEWKVWIRVRRICRFRRQVRDFTNYVRVRIIKEDRIMYRLSSSVAFIIHCVVARVS